MARGEVGEGNWVDLGCRVREVGDLKEARLSVVSYSYRDLLVRKLVSTSVMDYALTPQTPSFGESYMSNFVAMETSRIETLSSLIFFWHTPSQQP